MDIGLTALSESDIAKHLATAQSLVTRFTITEAARESGTEIAGTRRRFVPTVSTSGVKSAREVEFGKTLTLVTPSDTMLSPVQHNILYKTRRGLAVALAVADLFARQTGLDALHQRNASAVLEGADADRFRALLEASAYIAAFAAAAYVKQLVEGEGEPVSDIAPPAFNFATPQRCAEVAGGGAGRRGHRIARRWRAQPARARGGRCGDRGPAFAQGAVLRARRVRADPSARRPRRVRAQRLRRHAGRAMASRW